MMCSGLAVQTDGLRVAVGLGDVAVDGGPQLDIEPDTPRLSRRRVSLAKRPSTGLSHEAEVGVKWKVQRGCRANQARTFGCLWVA